ncbi:hypothetical protein G7Z17_g11758 [Cylindrodendrum hubeiense]|uniref:G domain-containing protein n=1 Tax=Cylindrodendrum hubeiense TaxID=595255 RepID=A0A9P5GZM5_9HYPO|nr:hypothetical protein G7Z17_g11758 [Cylindrodendrum hubeiense]
MINSQDTRPQPIPASSLAKLSMNVLLPTPLWLYAHLAQPQSLILQIIFRVGFSLPLLCELYPALKKGKSERPTLVLSFLKDLPQSASFFKLHATKRLMDDLMTFNPRPTDIVVAIMGMTGSGKSTFISLCTNEDVTIGHNLTGCTQEIKIYKCPWSLDVDIYLADTPGFDDTNRSDTDVLTDIATWLTKSYTQNVKLNGIIYLHRITDPRMQGSAKKNLFMFKKLCGTSVLENVALISTMWEAVAQADGERREKELINTAEFWGVLIKHGAKVDRHQNIRGSAIRLLKHFVKNKQMTMSIQKEMVSENKDLDQTQAGIELESEYRKEKEKFTRELEETRRMMKEALVARDQESAEMLRQYEADMCRKVEKVAQDREQLQISMEKMHAKAIADYERRIKEQQARIEMDKKETEKERERYRKQEEETKMALISLRQHQVSTDALQREKEAIQHKLEHTVQLLDTLSVPDTKTTIQYRTRSTPGPNRIQEHICLALQGPFYYFIGPAKDQ